ncbi:MAG: hypothetical protein ACRD0D_03105 [Acidimicrobiales bacterium]
MAAAVAVDLVVAVGLFTYVRSPAHQHHDPNHALQQLDLFYLDEPAPVASRLVLPRGVPSLVVVCAGCRAPRLAVRPVHVVVTDNAAVATAYGLRTAAGRVGPGYAIVDRRGHVRYRTFDPGLGHHRQEIDILLRAAR